MSRCVCACALVLLFVAASGVPAAACSICRCGDPTFNALGRDGYAARGLRVALDWERFDKDEGDPADEAESQVEQRYTTLVSFGFAEGFALFARVPYSERSMTQTGPPDPPESLHTSGVSDPEVYGQVRLWASRMNGDVGRRTSLSLQAGVKTPWGDNDVTRGGARVDEHAQPGTGSTDVFGSLALLQLVDPRSALFFSAGYRHTGENDFGYRYGSSVMANLAYEHKLGRIVDGVVELNYRDAREDQVDAGGTRDEDTGGSLWYATPRILVSLGRGLVLRLAAQIPIRRDLNGFQKERTVASVGLTYLFRH